MEEVKDEFEKLIKDREKFEQFLDENKDVPLNNIKIQTERYGKGNWGAHQRHVDANSS